MVAHRSGGDDLQAVGVELLRIELDLGGNNDDLRLFAEIGVEPERARAARNHQADVAIGNLIGLAGVDHRLHHFLLGHRDFQRNGLGRIVEAVDMLIEQEHPPVVGADALEHAVAIQQPMVEHRHHRILFIHQFVS